MENGNTAQTPTQNTNGGKGNFTTIRIYSGTDGQSYKLEVIEPEAKEGKRIDQVVAMRILAVDNQFRDPQFVNAIQQSRQNPMGFMQGMFQRMFGGGMGGGGMMPPMGGGMPPFGGGFM